MRHSENISHSTSPGKVFILLVFFILLAAISVFAQSKEEQKMRVKAVKALNSGKLAEAEAIYRDLIKLDPENTDYNYELGLSIFEQGVHKGDAAPFFAKAIKSMKNDTLPDMFLYAGKAEQYAGNFLEAIHYYHVYMRLMKARQGLSPDMLSENIPRYIEMCENGMVQFENNKDHIRIENMGDAINSVYADYSPVVAKDESVILFTSRRENTTGGDMDVDGSFYEDIYYSLNLNGTWTQASNVDSSGRIMNKELNTEDHDAAITYAADETQLYIYREEDVWLSELKDGIWTVPVRDKSRDNSPKGFEPSVFITEDQQTMFVVSELSIGYGGRDIYVTKRRPDGTWEMLKNLGKKINTRFDEDAPFLTEDGNTLYFASTGHNSMGDYDIFKSVLEDDGTWSVPENLGPPINTPGHDRYFVTTDNGAVGYYSSDRDGGFGETDIYRIILDCKSVSATMINGVVYSADKNGPVGATISIFDAKTGALINDFKADSTTGKYEMRLRTETDYKFKIVADGYMAHSGDFTVPQQCDYYALFQEIKIDNLEDSAGRVYAQQAYINNAFFNIDQKIKEAYAEQPEVLKDARKMDALRSVIASRYDPVKMTNYVRMIDILDPHGMPLTKQIIGEKDVALIQAHDETKLEFNSAVVKADQYYYSDLLPEARANYIVARGIDSTEAYPKQQIKIIDEKLRDAPLEAQLATIPEVDSSQLIVPEDPALVDNSSMIIPEEYEEIASVNPDAQPIVEPENNTRKLNTLDSEGASMNADNSGNTNLNMQQEETEQLENQASEAFTAALALNEEEDKIEEKSQEVSTELPVALTVSESEIDTQTMPEAEEIAATTEPKSSESKESTLQPKTTDAIAEETIVFRNILFDFDKSDLRSESVKELHKISDYMENKTEVELRIDGHADWIGTVEYNLALSERRAKAAHDFLVKDGISDARLTYQFFGEALPIAPNTNADGSDNPEGRQLNRRCEFKIDKAGTADHVVLKF